MSQTITEKIVQAHAVDLPAGHEVRAGDMVTIRPEGKVFEEAYHGLEEELRGGFDMVEHVIDKGYSAEEFAGLIRSRQPKLVVLMDNTAIALIRKYQSTLPNDASLIPSVAIMGVMIRSAIADIRNACGISYEIPIVTSVVSLRSVLGTPIKKVGVVHREFLTDFLERNREFCKREGIEIIGVALPDKSDSYGKQVNKALKELNDMEVDALWVPNDNALLQPDIIKNAWMRMVPKYKLPVIVGVEVLVNPQLNFGTFAVLPDHVSLGSQAAAMIFDIRDNNWIGEEGQVDPPLAIYKIINLPQAKRTFNVSGEKLKSVDKILK